MGRTAKQNGPSATDSLRSEISDLYRSITTGSAAMFERARHCMPGGVSGNLRYFAPYPLYTIGGDGCQITDVDGNRYIDCFGMNGPLLLGQRHPAIENAVHKVRSYGALPLNPDLMVEVAEAICDLVPCAERVRFLNTGTEATIMAVRYARAFTGRNTVVKFMGHYHGQQDQFLFGIDNSASVFSAGVPESATDGTIAIPYLDLRRLDALMQEQGHDIAAVILDPAMHAGGLWGSSSEELRTLKSLCVAHDVLLIFDEVITGFRLAPGGAQQFYGVTPDMATMAKALAAGEKLSAVMGREEIFSVVDPEAAAGTPRVFQSGTVNDGSAALAACKAALGVYRELGVGGAYEQLHQLSQKLRDGLKRAFKAHGIDSQINQLGSMLQIYIGTDTVDFASAGALAYEPVELFYLAMINEGVLLSLPTSNHIYLSFAHTEEDIEAIINAAHRVLDRHDFLSIAAES